MAAPRNTAGQPKYNLRNSSDALPTPAASGQQVHPRRSAFDGIINPPAESFSGREHLPYDVFINHYGEDTKYTVANNIYKKLDGTGLRVFLDKNELELGDFFPGVLEEAMARASLHIAIFSENYAKSPWCLAELAFMLQTHITFIPIFYHVDPFTVRWAIEGKGGYANAFNNHEMKGRYSSEKLQSWKFALHNASLYTGEIINNEGKHEKTSEDEFMAVENDAAADFSRPDTTIVQSFVPRNKLNGVVAWPQCIDQNRVDFLPISVSLGNII